MVTGDGGVATTEINLEFGIRPLRGREVDGERRDAVGKAEAAECVCASAGGRPLAERSGELLQEVARAGREVAGLRVADVVEVEQPDMGFGRHVLGVDPVVLPVVVPVVTLGTREIVGEPELVIVVDPVLSAFEIEPGIGVFRTGERVAVGVGSVAPRGIPRDFPPALVLPAQPCGRRTRRG